MHNIIDICIPYTLYVGQRSERSQAVYNSSQTRISYTTLKDTQNTPGMDPVIAMY